MRVMFTTPHAPNVDNLPNHSHTHDWNRYNRKGVQFSSEFRSFREVQLKHKIRDPEDKYWSISQSVRLNPKRKTSQTVVLFFCFTASPSAVSSANAIDKAPNDPKMRFSSAKIEIKLVQKRNNTMTISKTSVIAD